MAIIRFVDKKNPRRKKFTHIWMRFRSFVFKSSLSLNLLTIIYFAHIYGHLTNIYDWYNQKIAPFLESLINKLPL